MSNINVTFGLPKWQMAVLLSAPLAFGIGYMYFRKPTAADIMDRNRRKLSKDRSITKSLSIDSDEKDKKTPAEILEELQTKPMQTPLEKAVEWKNQGNASFRTGKFNDAIRSYDEAIKSCPLDNKQELSTFYQNRAAAYEQLKKWSMVKADCTAALNLNPSYAKALSRRAKANELLDDLRASLEDITATCILEGFRNDVSLTYADRVLKKLGERNAKDALVSREIIYPSESTIKAYFASFSNDPINRTKMEDIEESCAYNEARKAFAAKDYTECVLQCEKEIKKEDAKYVPHAGLLLGSLLFLSGQLNEATNQFDAIILHATTHVSLKSSAHVRRALVHMHHKKFHNAMDDLMVAQELDPDNTDVYQQRAVIYVQMDRTEEALNEMEYVLKIEPTLVTAQIQQAYFNYRYAHGTDNAVKIYTAIQSLQHLHEKHPKNTECSSLLAQVLTEQQQYDKALPILKRSIELDDTNATAYVHLGLLHLQWNGDIAQALQMIETAIDKDPKCELAYETLGTIEVQRGRLNEAINLFEKALKLCRTEVELIHVFSLRDAALAQREVAQRMQLDLERLAQMTFGGEVMAPQ